MKNWKLVLIAVILVCTSFWLPALQSPRLLLQRLLPHAIPEPTDIPEPVDIVLWAQATVTEAGPPPDDWIAYQRIKDELNINLTYEILPTGADGEAKLNASAAANNLPDLLPDGQCQQ